VRRLHIAIDCDGILSDFTAGALRVVEEVTGRHYEPADVGEFDFTKALGLSASESRAYAEAINTRRGFASSLAPYPGARQGVRRLRDLGEVFCVTTPWDGNPWWREEREAWLALHFGIDRVHHAEDKSAYEADVFVDDRSKHVRAWLAAWPGRVAVFWRTPHNTSETVPAGAHSSSSWEALYQLAREHALGPVQRRLPAAEEGSP
jgi:5'(3')-deoxyribonucleotidase